jgi:hypothetical protein
MKRMSCYAIPLSVAALAIAGSSRAQDTIMIPDVSVQAQDIVVPDVSLKTRVVHIPKIRIQTHVESIPDLVMLKTQETAGKIALAQTLKEYTSNQIYSTLAGGYTPEMSKKTREIALLRRMLDLKLTARDIERALPLLRELKDVGKEVPAKPDQALDEELQRLLRAKPGDPMPPSSAEALRDAASGFRTRRLAIWDKMEKAIGKEKSAGIRSMLRSEPLSIWSSNGAFRNVITSPTWTVPAAPGTRNTGPRGRTAPRSDTPPADAPGLLEPAKPNDPAPPPDDATPEAARARRAERATARAQRAAPGAPGTTVIAPGRVMAFGQTGNGTNFSYTFYTQASIEELIDLFERHLAAMK